MVSAQKRLAAAIAESNATGRCIWSGKRILVFIWTSLVKPTLLALKIDFQLVLTERVLHAQSFVADSNTPMPSFDMTFAPTCKMDDMALFVVTAKKASRFQLIKGFLAFSNASHMHMEFFDIFKVSALEYCQGGGVLGHMNCSGEPLPVCKTTLNVAHKALQFVY
ncbi:hypothetical protein HDU98_007232 [Podochytrium sp. JEL0797]|nr:hypothetical protein HDU98_007232 [Podochytrium sp. JEL0797]